MERKIRFFKILAGDFVHRLRIPPAFVKYMKKDITHATLECPNGTPWIVRLQKRSSGLYLESGWQQFVKKHCLKNFDFLVFGYDGGVEFTVQIYDGTACQKEDVCIKKASPDHSCELSHDRIPIGETEGHKICDVHLRLRSCRDVFIDSVQGLGEPQNDGHVKIEMKNVKCSVDAKADLRRQRQLLVERAREKANGFTSRFPYFLSQMTNARTSRGGMLHIPSSFRKEHLHGRRMEMVVQSPDGTLWEVTYVSSHHQGSLSRGWDTFSRYHNLAVGDFCTFELLDEKTLRAQIFPVVE